MRPSRLNPELSARTLINLGCIGVFLASSGLISRELLREREIRNEIAAQRAAAPITIRGNMSRDFGDVEFVSGRVSHSHTFIIENTDDTDHAVEVIGASCGCIALAPAQQITRLAPGQSFELPTTITFTEPGIRHGQIWLRVDEQDEGIVTLELRGTAVRTFSWYTDRGVLRVDPARDSSLTLIFNTFESEQPSPPRFEHDASVTASFTHWTRIREPDLDRRVPGRWETTVIVQSLNESHDPAKSTLVIRPHGDDITSVKVELKWSNPGQDSRERGS